MMTDPIADMFIRIKNASVMRHETVTLPSSKMKTAILEVLKNEGYITDYSVTKDVKSTTTITLKYTENNSGVIKGIKRISKPSLHVYANVEDLPRVLNGLGVAIISTSQGVMTDKQARKLNIGGEVLAYVW